jgi:hypothetical protein
MSASSAAAYEQHLTDEEVKPNGKASEPIYKRAWPAPLAPAAFHGIVGEIANAIAPISEADIAATVFQTLAAFSCAVGPNVYFEINNGRHPVLDNVAIVGATSKARKGTSWSPTKAIIRGADPSLVLVSGLSSGEGLIERVRDASEPNEKGEIQFPGVDDKRLLIVEAEFASVLKQVQRPGNTLSPVLRDAWDANSLSTLTRKNNALTATDPHIVIIGHVTRDELVRCQAEQEWHNGFGNRFLWCCAKRSQFLPEGASLEEEVMDELIMKTGQALTVASKIGRVEKSPEAKEYWAQIYADLSQGHCGLFGDMTARSEAHTLRLGYLFAVLDGYDRMHVEHLNAALAVWRYAEDSARFLFGEQTGDPLADEILALLKKAGAEGLTRTELSNLFGRNKTAARLNAAITTLEEYGKVRRVQEATGGRSVERIVLTNTN